MNGYTHAVAGTASLWLIAPAIDEPFLMGACAFGAVIAALAPDVDSKQSLLQSHLPPVRLIGSMIRSVESHRGILHSLALWYAVTVVFLIFLPTWQVALAISLGHLSHLVLDMCTVRGLNVLWPYEQKVWTVPKHLRVRVTAEVETAERCLFGVLAFASASLLISVMV